jgi:hypothetical protein
MVVIDDYISGGNYLKAEDVKKSTERICIITKEPKMTKFTHNGKEKENLTADVEFDGTEKVFSLNKTNARIIAGVFGNETKDWIGKILALNPTKVNVDGDLKDSIQVDEDLTRHKNKVE